jgi:hypothetical protein
LITTYLFDVGQRYQPFFHPDYYLHKPHEPPTTEQPEIKPCVFIIAPPNSPSISTIYTTILSGVQRSQNFELKRSKNTKLVKPEDITLQILDHISLLQYLDLTGLAESISEISSLISPPHHSSNNTSAQSDKTTKSILLLEGLSSTLAQALNRSSTALTQTAALLTNILRSLRQLVRSRPEVLVVIELEIALEAARTFDSARNLENGAEVLNSAFADGKGRLMILGPCSGRSVSGVGTNTAAAAVGGSGGRGGGSQANVVLARILENALDGIVVVHDGLMDDDEHNDGFREGSSVKENNDRSRIVEVVKDGLGSGFGVWAVWKR